MNKAGKGSWRTLFILVLCAAGLYLLKPPCIWKQLFGISCPSCGMTRAAEALIQLDFRGAWSYHPMIYSLPVLAVGVIRDGKFTEVRWADGLIWSAVILGFLWHWVLVL